MMIAKKPHCKNCYLSFRVPNGLEDVSTYPDLFAELIDRGWSDEDLKKLAGNNLIRAFRKAEEVSRNQTKNIYRSRLSHVKIVVFFRKQIIRHLNCTYISQNTIVKCRIALIYIIISLSALKLILLD